MLKLKCVYKDNSIDELLLDEKVTFEINLDKENPKILTLALRNPEVAYENKVKYYLFYRDVYSKFNNVEVIELYNNDILLYNSKDFETILTGAFIRENEPGNANFVNLYFEFTFNDIMKEG